MINSLCCLCTFQPPKNLHNNNNLAHFKSPFLDIIDKFSIFSKVEGTQILLLLDSPPCLRDDHLRSGLMELFPQLPLVKNHFNVLDVLKEIRYRRQATP